MLEKGYIAGSTTNSQTTISVEAGQIEITDFKCVAPGRLAINACYKRYSFTEFVFAQDGGEEPMGRVHRVQGRWKGQVSNTYHFLLLPQFLLT